MFQRARMARIQMNSTVALTNFIESKRREMLSSFEPPNEYRDDDRRPDKLSENLLQQQYNHLLSCLEQTTVSTLLRRAVA